MSKKIYLIDGNSFIYRMFFALPEFSTSDWRVVNAIFWMAKFFTGQLVKENPDTLIFIKDAKGNNFRHEIYSEYKATRERMPDNLRSQIKGIEDMIEKMNIDTIEIPGYEADDVIATLAKQLEAETSDEIYVLSWDKDLYALVSEQIKIYDTQKKKISWPEETEEKFWVKAPYVTDYLAICWDTSDNIPGVAGIWPKKVEVLINEFWTTEEIYDVVDRVVDSEIDPLSFSLEAQKIFKGKTFEKLRDGRENAFLSKKLATLALDVDLPNFRIEDYEFDKKWIITPELEDFFKDLEFHSLLSNTTKEKNTWKQTWKKVKIIGDKQWLDELSTAIALRDIIVLDTETSSLNPRVANLVGVSILLDEDEIYYINLLHSWPQVDQENMQKFIQMILHSEVTVIWHNIKYDLQVLESFLKKWNEIITHSSDESLWQTTLEI